MFQVKGMRIFFLTRHVSVAEAITQMTKERVHDYLIRCDKALQRLGVENRKLAVAGLNPHAGEGGLFGNEEVEEIKPGVEAAKADGIDAYGPVPADSVFFQALNGKYDAVLSLYHDQGHIAAKMTDFHRTISITNGLPFLRREERAPLPGPLVRVLAARAAARAAATAAATTTTTSFVRHHSTSESSARSSPLTSFLPAAAAAAWRKLTLRRDRARAAARNSSSTRTTR